MNDEAALPRFIVRRSPFIVYVISIIIPTLNESARIAPLLRHTAALAGEREIIVVDGGSTDGTPAIVERANVEGVRLIRAPRGRASQMNAARSSSSTPTRCCRPAPCATWRTPSNTAPCGARSKCASTQTA